MKITREALKNIVKETMIEESEYQEFFKRALEKAGKSIPQMSDEEKKKFLKGLLTFIANSFEYQVGCFMFFNTKKVFCF